MARAQAQPAGDAYRVATRGGPSDLRGAPPISAEARRELVVIKTKDAFLCANRDGNIGPSPATGEGLYSQDTRHLSELALTFGEVRPILLSHLVEHGFHAVVNGTNPTMRDVHGVEVPQDTLNLRRRLVIADRLYYAIELRNFGPRAVAVPLWLTLSADFADVFEARETRPRPLHHAVQLKAQNGNVEFACEGRDGTLRKTLVEFDPPAASCDTDGPTARQGWTIELEQGGSARVLITMTPSSGGARRRRRRIERATRDLEGDLQSWVERCTGVETDNPLFQRVVEASLRDLHALLTPAPGGTIPAGGIPWYVAPFGRDSLLTSHECLLITRDVARENLLVLAKLQAQEDEPWRDAEPGKILHELRSGDLAKAGLIPHTPYYGTVDATPLFVVLAGAYWRWTADEETMGALRGPLDAALEWIDRYGDADGDGFIEYERRSEAGLLNQGWKDSEDAIVHADGSLAEGPIALVEAQAYVYLAKIGIAEVYEMFGEGDRARELRRQAHELRVAFNEAFWNEEEGTYVLALDGRKRQVASVTSNAGHALYCGIVDRERAPALAERLMAEDMFSGWGVRTLSGSSPAYNPMSYHNGSVWPHDNAIIAAGLKRYGFEEAAQRIAAGLFSIAGRARDWRLAELYCGFDRVGTGGIVDYPVACMPQAWAAATPFMLLHALLGVAAHAPTGTLELVQPSLPSWLGRAELHDLKVGDASVSLAFTQTGGITGFSLLDQQGELAVTMAATPR